MTYITCCTEYLRKIMSYVKCTRAAFSYEIDGKDFGTQFI